MYSRTVTVRKPNGKTYMYEQVVKSKRVDGKPRQEVVANLGRVAEGLSPQDREAFLRVLRKWVGEPEAQPVRQVSADVRDPELGESRSYGDIVAVEDAWEALGLKRLLQESAKDSGHAFDLERAIFAMTANRLIDPRSKYGTADWLYRDVYLPVAVPLDADQFYAALTWLAKHQSDLELALYRLLAESGRVDATAVFYDTSAVWFEGRGPEGLAERGRPKGTHPPNRRLILLGLIRSINGWPIAHRVFPGNTADVTTVEPMLRELVERFGIRRFIFVCDRGMISAQVIELFERLGVEYVIATKLRGDAEVRDEVLGRAGRFRELDRQLGVKEVWCEERRYVLCRNQVEVAADERRRNEIIDTLEKKHLNKPCAANTKRAKQLVAHKTFGRYLIERNGFVVLDRAKVKADSRYDGKWVLRTNTSLPAEEVARLYRQQSGVEKDFRDIKTFIELRPVYHRLEPRVRAHVFVCVLAKVVTREFETRLHRSGFVGTSVDAVMEELGRLQVTEVGTGDERRFVRARLHPAQHDLLRRLGIDPAALPHRLPVYPLVRPRRVKLDNVQAEEARQRRKRARHEAWLAESGKPHPPPSQEPPT